MSQATHDMKQEMKQGRETLKTLRDEVRVKLHLAGMDARDTWAELSKEMDKVSREADATAYAALHDVVARCRAFLARLDGTAKSA
jgi:hypothetical protein